MPRYLILILATSLFAACDEPSPQWKDDHAVIDDGEKDINDERDIKDEDLFDQTDQLDQPDVDDAVPDDPVSVDCTVADPTTAEKNALEELFPEDDTAFCTDKTPSGVDYFIAVREGETIGYAFPATNIGFGMRGEGAPVTAITGLTSEGVSIGIQITQQNESWWYRMGQWFFDQFKDIDITQITLDPKYNKNCYPCSEMYDAFKPFTVDAVSGATYTSNAVTKDVWDAIYLYDELFSPPTVNTAP